MANPMMAGLRPVHPGELLREDVLPAFGVPKSKIAELLGISRQQLYDILDGKKPITTNTALRIGKLCGDGPGIWLRMQQAYDLAVTEPQIHDELERIPTLQAA